MVDNHHLNGSAPGGHPLNGSHSDEHLSNGLERKKSVTIAAPPRHPPQPKLGVDILRDPEHNKGLAFTLVERRHLGLEALLPPIVLTQDQQAARIKQRLSKLTDPLQKYEELMSLSQRNQQLFYRVINDNITEYMPLIYTPIVGAACQAYGEIYRRPQGIYITSKDKGKISRILQNVTNDRIKAICFTDGERILGLGDLGAWGMGIPVGKLALYTACAGVDPQTTLPVVIDVGTNTQSLLENPFYTGLKQRRDRSPAYDELLEEFVAAAKDRWGEYVLLQWEDFANANASRLLTKFRDRACTFNDDIQGTASVAVAGLLAAVGKIRPYKKLKDHKFVLYGAGSANCGIGFLLAMAIQQEDLSAGLTMEDALQRIWMVDSKGLIVSSRTDLTEDKKLYVKPHEHIRSLEEIVHRLKPTALIGATAMPGSFTEGVVRAMAEYNDFPIIFALSNPTSKAECTAEQAYNWSAGRALFASGSPFAPVEYKGRIHVPGQGNNSYIFPGVALAITAVTARRVTDQMFLIAAQTLAKLVDDDQLAKGCLYPPLKDIRSVSAQIAAAVGEEIYRLDLAVHQPKPVDMLQFMSDAMYSFEYPTYVPQS